MTDDGEREPWFLPVGERLTPERANAVIARFGAEVRAVGEAVAAQLRAEDPIDGPAAMVDDPANSVG